MNLFKQADGNVQALVCNRPFLSGEMFVQTENITKSSEYIPGSTSRNAGKSFTNLHFIDAVTRAPISQFFKGDLYGGCGYGANGKEDSDGNIPIYQLGSGNALKLAPEKPLIQFWDKDSREVIKAHPNCLYLYVGDPTKARSSNETSGTVGAGVGESSTTSFPGYESIAKDGDIPAYKKINLGDAGREVKTNELSNELNTGDMVFYSPIYDIFMVWHLSRTTSNLVRMLTANLTSKSLKTKIGGDFNLTTYINKVARNFQSLDNEEGWAELAYVGTSNKEGTFKIAAGDDSDYDGAIYRVPFKVEVTKTVKGEETKSSEFLNFAGTYNFKFTDEAEIPVLPGDVIISLPIFNSSYKEIENESVALGTKHVVVSLYGDYLKKNDISQLEITRADDYADYRHGDADKALEDELKAGDSGLKEILENIYSTKVDIDPVTHKVVTSQLPSFVLGGLKLVGSTDYAELSTFAEGEALTDPKKGENRSPATMFVAKRIADKWNEKLGLVDSNGNATGDVAPITPFDFDANGADRSDLKDKSGKDLWGQIYEEFESAVGSYFIWAGDPTYIDTNSSTENTDKVAPNTPDDSYAKASDDRWYPKNKLNEVKETVVLPGFEKEAVSDETGSYLVADVSKIDLELLETLKEEYNAEEVEELAGRYVDAKYATKEVTEIVAETGTVGFDEQPYLTPVKLDHLSSKYFSAAALALADDADNHDATTSVMLNAGDFLIYNGDTFDIIDNSSSISGILFSGALITGTPEIKRETRKKSQIVILNGTKSTRANTVTEEVEIKREGDALVFQATRALLVNQDEDVDIDHIPVIDKTSRLVSNSSFKFVQSSKATAGNKITGITSDVNFGTATDADYVGVLDFTTGDSDVDQVFESNILADTRCAEEALDTPLAVNTHQYATLSTTRSTTLSLPKYSGILTTEDYVQSMGRHLFAIMQAEVKAITSGNINWLQTVVANPTAGKANIIDDSAFVQIHDRTNVVSSLGLQVGGRNKDDDTANLTKVTAKGNLASDYNDDHKGTTAQPSWQKNLTEGPTGVLSGIPTALAAGQEVILPNHGGILLTTDSVIDCGTWL